MRKFIILILLFSISLFLYGRYIEVNNIKVNNYNIVGNVPNSFKDLKIVHFSDVLYDGDTKKLDKLVTKINHEQADIIIFSGDLFKQNNNYSDDDLNKLKESFTNMNATLYKIAIFGDNDYKYQDQYIDLLYDANFKLLDNDHMLFFYKDKTPINIIGINDLNKIDELMQTDVEVKYHLVITHQPDNASKIVTKNVSTILSGHSLGGIIHIPFIGGIIKKDGAKKYFNSYYKINETELFISNGLGYYNFNFRLFNTPSINVYNFIT